jgi:TM2 domain-containing membrane protein YozV
MSGTSPQVLPKNPALGLLASFFIPGLGSLLVGRVGMGVLIFSMYVLSLLLMFVLIGFITTPLVWLWGMFDGYNGAKSWNSAHGIVS